MIKKYRVLKNGKPLKIKERSMRNWNDSYATSLDWAYVLSNKHPGSEIKSIDGTPVKPLRHLMKGTLPEDVNWEPKKQI